MTECVIPVLDTGIFTRRYNYAKNQFTDEQ